MNNTTTKVGPLTGIDFSKLRTGGRIHKFQPGGSVTNVGYNTGTTWADTVYTQELQDKIYSVFKDPNSTPEQLEAAAQKLNEIQKQYETLRKQNTLGNSATYNKAVQDYQTKINTEYGDINTIGINNGVTKSRYTYTTDPNSGDNSTSGWKADGYWGAQTQDRTVLGYDGDWDEMSDRFKQLNEMLKARGYKLSKGLDGDSNYTSAYYINKLSTPTGSTNTGLTQRTFENIGPNPSAETPGDYTPDDYDKFKFKKTPFTTPIVNGLIAGLGLVNNKRRYNNEMQKKVVLKEAPYQQHVVTNDYARQQAYNNSAVRFQDKAAQIADQAASLEQNQAVQLAGASQAEDYRNQGELEKATAFNKSVEAANTTGNYNKLQSTNTANTNRQNLVADWNRRLDAKSAYQTNRTAVLQDNIVKNATDYGNYKAQEENERDAALSKWNKHKMEQDLQRASKDYQYLYTNKTSSNAFKGILQRAYNEYNSNLSLSDDDLDDEGKAMRQFFYDNQELSDEELASKFAEWMQAHPTSKYTTDFTTAYNTELEDAYKKYQVDRQRIESNYNKIQPSFRETYNTQGYYRTTGQEYQSVYAKNGGILFAKKGERFIDYLNHNRRALEHSQKIAMQTSEQLRKSAQFQLNALNQETIMLLRSIFK